MDPNTGGNSTLLIVSPARGYVLSGKLMFSGIVVLFGIAILLLFLHFYVRWHVVRRHDRVRRRLNRLIFSASAEDRQNAHPKSAPCGLDKEVLNSLSIEIFSDDDADADADVEEAECAVCLNEFDEGEKMRVLPRCGHRFHVDCIDMWFFSHSTCPLCRCAVEAAASPAPAAADTAVAAPDPRVGEVRIEIPEESGSSTSTGVVPVKLPGHRLISSIRRFFIVEPRVESADRPSSSPPPPPPPPPPPQAAAQ
ncbi:uncharacterized protein M6B38_148480 [Iris pallida]|uniref:RING-type E3 ubiquitin transferase n=1 Tax=Iris pallida TaxID=29817 RepID=A0AAX6F8E5_IRIPA|nr:uncharacterized protein M6B38_148480 [Iris pallida]